MPIGISAKGQEPFTCNELDLFRGYSMYLFSDGYIDQFGGPSGKKLMTKAFKEILLDTQDISMIEQGEVLNDKLQEWMKDIAQVNDIIVIGIQLDEG